MKLLPVTLLLLAVFALSMLGSYLQHRYYLRTVNALARDYRSGEYVLASGLRKGRTRGTIAILVLSRENPAVIEKALLMSGRTVFARFHDRPDLTGLAGAARLSDQPKAIQAAVADAMARGRRAASPGEEATIPDQPTEGVHV